MLHLSHIFQTLMRRKFGVFLMILQITFATAIFSNLGFVSQGLDQMAIRPSGINDDQLFSVTLSPIGSKINYSDAERDIRSIQEIPGVEGAAILSAIPLSGNASNGLLRTSIEKDAPTQFTTKALASPQALATLGLHIIAGRNFQLDDMYIQNATNNEGSHKIIITHALAKTLFKNEQNAVGKTVYEDDYPLEIIGVTNDWLGFQMRTLDSTELTQFKPHFWEDDSKQTYLVKTQNHQTRAATIEEVSQILTRNYHNQLMLIVEKIDEAKYQGNKSNHILSMLLMIMNIVLGFVVAFAISGQTLFWINQRTKQLGVRRALGASQGDIVLMLITENAIVCIFGLTLGILLSLVVNQAVIQIGMPPMPPVFLIGTCMVLLGICFISAAIPAWRASKISPSIATRSV